MKRLALEIFRPHAGWIALFAALGLVMVGLVAIRTTPGASLATKQTVWIFPALIAMMFTALPHHRRILGMTYPLMFVVLILLSLLLLPLPQSIVPVINGSKRWFDLQVTLFQPSELAKVVYVLSLAVYLRYRENYRTMKGLLIPLGLSFVPIILILKEPDLGTAMTFLPVFFAMMIAAGAKLKHIIIIVLMGVAVVPAMYPMLKPHQKARIKAIIAQSQNDKKYIQTIGYQGYVAKTLVGSGELTGQGSAHAGMLIKYNRLPESHNDMVFAAVCARWGMMGGLLVIGLYLTLIFAGLYAAALNHDPFARLVAVGIVTVIFFQMFVNIGMTIGILPITGMTLPFISYGGSSLVVNLAMIGLIFNVAARKPLILGNRAFEFDGMNQRRTKITRMAA